MNLSHLIDDLKVSLLNTAFSDSGTEWNYTNVISPFSRIYYITDGEGFILPNNVMYKLKPGYMYLIPSYIFCSYYCVDHLSQYYVHFTNELPDGLKIFDYLPVSHEVKASPNDLRLFKRLQELNTDAALPQSDPSVYEKKNWIKSRLNLTNPGKQLETAGILKQLLSRFIQHDTPPKGEIQLMSTYRKVFNYINTNLEQEIRIEQLATIACCSADHFTRTFKRITGMVPVDYINKKRIEKAQVLLLTTGLSQKEISDRTGFNSLQYYTLIFKKYTGISPARYRRMGGLI